MKLTISTTTTETVIFKTEHEATVLAAVIAGRPVTPDEGPIDRDAAYDAATAFFSGAGITTLETYLAHRSLVKEGLRDAAVQIREMKKAFRPLNGTCDGFYAAQNELEAARRNVRKLHDTRVLGKAWSAETRRRKAVDGSAAAA